MNPIKRMIALCAIAVALAACSRDLSAQSTRAEPPLGAMAPAAVQAPGSVPAPATEPALRSLPDFSQLVDRYGPAVVNVEVVEKAQSAAGGVQGLSPNDPFYDFFRRFGVPGPEQGPRANQHPARGAGSGFIINSDGYILTNTHVVANADEVTVRLTDRREFPAKVIGADERTDVAVIKISASNLPIVKLGDPSRIKPGQWVLAIGSPFGFENSATAGIISATSRSVPGENYVPFIQTDVAVNPGNSGGPLFNLKGEVIGVNSQIFSHSGGFQGLAFAVPIDIAMQVEDQLQKHGKVEHGRLGVTIQEVNQALAQNFGLKSAAGALVGSVQKGSAAAKAGIEPGDVITRFNGKEINASADLPPLVSSLKPNTQATLEIWRDGKSKQVTVTIGALEDKAVVAEDSKADLGKARLGIAVRPLSPEEMRDNSLPNGLVVEDVAGAAARAGIRAGDVIVAVNNTPVKTPAQLKELVAKSGKTVALLIQRDDARIFVPLTLG
jgi:serine protease Do